MLTAFAKKLRIMFDILTDKFFFTKSRRPNQFCPTHPSVIGVIEEVDS